ncbi:MAG: hypothetical protein WA435_08965 [Gallionellaceae bacterium]
MRLHAALHRLALWPKIVPVVPMRIIYNTRNPMMLKAHSCTLAAIAVMFSLTAYGADPVTEQSQPPSAPQAQKVPTEQEIASNPARFLRAAIQADDMGYLSAAVLNPTSVAVANVYVVVVHFDEKTRQPDGQTVPLLVAAKLAPKQSARIKLPGMQVFKQAEFNLYRAIVARAELAK